MSLITDFISFLGDVKTMKPEEVDSIKSKIRSKISQPDMLSQDLTKNVADTVSIIIYYILIPLAIIVVVLLGLCVIGGIVKLGVAIIAFLFIVFLGFVVYLLAVQTINKTAKQNISSLATNTGDYAEKITGELISAFLETVSEHVNIKNAKSAKPVHPTGNRGSHDYKKIGPEETERERTGLSKDYSLESEILE